jgi:hypothetical protein
VAFAASTSFRSISVSIIEYVERKKTMIFEGIGPFRFRIFPDRDVAGALSKYLAVDVASVPEESVKAPNEVNILASVLQVATREGAYEPAVV